MNGQLHKFHSHKSTRGAWLYLPSVGMAVALVHTGGHSWNAYRISFPLHDDNDAFYLWLDHELHFVATHTREEAIERVDDLMTLAKSGAIPSDQPSLFAL